MRAVAVSVWIFINLVFVGMCGYIYLLWSQYWRYVERQHSHMAGGSDASINTNSGGGSYTSTGNGQIYYYYQSSSSSSSSSESLSPAQSNANALRQQQQQQHGRMVRNNRTMPKHHSRERRNRTAVTVLRVRSQPRFPKMRTADSVEADRYLRCADGVDGVADCSSANPPQPAAAAYATDKMSARVAAYKSQLVVQLRRVLLEESSVFKARGEASNPYGVRYAGPRGTYQGRTVRQLVCELKHAVRMRTVDATDEPFLHLGLGVLFPARPLLGADGHRYNTCSIVTNAGSLDGSGLGEFIDTHDLVLRFNHAPTVGHERDVGSKTTIRIVNSQVVSKPKFNFLESPLYRNVSLLAWDPSNYSATLDEWYSSPDFDLFTPYFRHRALHPHGGFHLLDPRSLWSLWDYIQGHIPVRIRRNPPSSGFLGLALLLPHCALVDLVEYVPSVRLTKRCHYWDVAEDLSCTFGVWHPLAAEKLLALALNTADDLAVFSDGYVRVPGYATLGC